MPSYTAAAVEKRDRLPWLHPRDRKFERLVDRAVIALFGLTKPPKRCQRDEIARRLRYRVALYELGNHPLAVPSRDDPVRREDRHHAVSVRQQDRAFAAAMRAAG